MSINIDNTTRDTAMLVGFFDELIKQTDSPKNKPLRRQLKRLRKTTVELIAGAVTSDSDPDLSKSEEGSNTELLDRIKVLEKRLDGIAIETLQAKGVISVDPIDGPKPYKIEESSSDPTKDGKWIDINDLADRNRKEDDDRRKGLLRRLGLITGV